MSYRLLALAVAAFSSMHVASADAQSVYVAPGGVYIGGGPVYVIPAPNGPTPYAAPTYGYEYGYGYGSPAVPGPAVVAPTAAYGLNGGYYDAPFPPYAGASPRPPVAVPYYGNYGNGRCAARYGYGQRWQSCY